MNVGFGLKTPSLLMDFVYYPHWTDIPANFNIPVSPKHLCSQIYIETGSDYNADAIMMQNV
jgi:hypothetical protein